jgi:hypothetical protein
MTVMTSWQDEVASQWQYHVNEFYRIQEGQSFWMPSSYAWGTMMPAVVGTTLVCSILFWVVAPTVVTAENLLDNHPPKDDTSNDNNNKNNTNNVNKLIKARYQFTNLCFNMYIGGLGLYYDQYVLPTLPSHYYDNVIDKIPGHGNIYIFSALQLGYQLWALPVGLYCVKESKEMLVHHLAVVLASTMSGFSYCGFRYFSVYFYGLMELSSIPLAVMNAFKDNPSWVHRYPFLFLSTRAAFSFSFLYLRIYMWCFIGPQFLVHDFFLFWTVRGGFFVKIFLLLQFVLGLFLGVLQLYWGFLVMKGMISFFVNLPAKIPNLMIRPTKETYNKTKPSEMKNGYSTTQKGKMM